MATWRDVRRIALALPESAEKIGGMETTAWTVRGKLFAWERPLRPSDREALGDDAPAGAILAIRTADLDLKEALLLSDPAVFFTTPHFDGYAAVLIVLANISTQTLRDVLVESWLHRAPKRAADAFLAEQKTVHKHKPRSIARTTKAASRASAFAIKAEVEDPAAKTFAFVAQKTMYGGKEIAQGDTVFVFASENEGGRGLVARGVVTEAKAIAKKRGDARQTPRVSITVRRTALAKRQLGRSELKRFADWNDGKPETELNFKFYRQATDKIVGISAGAASYLSGYL